MRSWYQLCTAVLLSSLALGVYGNEVKVVCTAASIESSVDTGMLTLCSGPKGREPATMLWHV